MAAATKAMEARNMPTVIFFKELGEMSERVTLRKPWAPFSSCPQSLPASESFPVNQLFA